MNEQGAERGNGQHQRGRGGHQGRGNRGGPRGGPRGRPREERRGGPRVDQEGHNQANRGHDRPRNGGRGQQNQQIRDHENGNTRGRGAPRNWRDRPVAGEPAPKAVTLYEENQVEEDENVTGRHRRPRDRPLKFDDLKQLSQETTEPSEIMQRLANPNCGLEQLLQENSANWDVQELVLVIMGTFCKKQGATQFQTGFIDLAKIMGERKIFQNVCNIMFQLPSSRSTNLPPKAERLKRLIESIYYLTCNVLTLMPRFGCNYLGDKFIRNIIALKDFPAISELKITEPIFDILQEAEPLLKNAWEENTKEMANDENKDQRLERRAQFELSSMEKPPDDFRRLNVVPQTEDVCTDASPYLRPNIIDGRYPDAHTYLDIQFRLLREDFFYPLRVGIQSYKNQLQKKTRRIRADNVRLYHDVKILPNENSTNRFTLQFSIKGMGKVQWEASKRLLYGSLLCLSSDDFTSILLFTVLDRNPQQLSLGKITAQYEGGVLPRSKTQATYIMAESSAYFEAYRSVLLALQHISPANFPLKDYILGMRTTADEPDYMAAAEVPTYDLSTVPVNFAKTASDEDGDASDDEESATRRVVQPISSLVKRMLSRVWIRDVYNRPSHTDLRLDPSQCEALYAALTRKVAVIQGPPGTGKTFLGLKIVQVLLQNSQYWRNLQTNNEGNKSPKTSQPKPAPILVICYTNHALDQFLEGIMSFTQKIVRIGGQSKCEKLEGFSLREWKRRAQTQRTRPAAIGRWFFEVRDKIAKNFQELNAHREIMTAVGSTGLVHEETMKSMKVLGDGLMAKLRNWRLEWNRRNGTRMIPTSGSASILPHWLGVNSPEVVSQVLAVFMTEWSKRKPAEEAAPVAEAEEEGELNEADQWEKEDIDEIQAQRIVDDDTLPSIAFEETVAKLSAEAKVKVQFGYLTDKISEDIEKMEKELEELKKDKELNESETFELQSKPIDQAVAQQLEELNDELLQLNAEIEAKGFNLALTRNYLLEIKNLLEILPPVEPRQLAALENQNFYDMSFENRWRLYGSWRKRVLDLMEEKESHLEQQYAISNLQLKEVETLDSAEVCRSADIIGITTTGAAKQRALLEHLKPKIVVVEEAAEVLEAHIVTALSPSCQHLILIGDHQQLRPPTTVYHLARKFHLDVSLFERLVRNGVNPCVLGVQHRMRPEVARLIVPSIYKSLQNHESVYEFPEVRGMERSVFFLAHTQRELNDQEGRSHVNPYEVDMSLALARHLLMQGYKTSQITILTTYSGQLLQFRKSRKGHAMLQGIRIATVDNFQGEENDVIILSLVRSNEDDNIGFLKIENRICVALSRAKQGFYLLGNMMSLQGKSRLWNNINDILSRHSELGSKFPLKCEVHDTRTQVSKPTEFPPEGGCLLKCQTAMPCGHICPKICHLNDRPHVEYRCNAQCTRSCDFGHPCPKKCWQDCKPCLTKVVKKLLCGHSQSVECHRDPKEEFCVTVVEKILAYCQHKQEMHCGKPPAEVKCVEQCGMLLDCNHICNLRCHRQSSHKEKPCQQPCRRSPCLENHPCPKLCHEPCGNCLTEVEKLLPCGHQVKIKCFILPKDAFCPVQVEKTLGCGHTAKFQCSEATDSFKCKKPCQKPLCADGHVCRKLCYDECGPCSVQIERILPCGHKMWMQCHKNPSSARCTFPVERILPACGHKVSIACGDDPATVRCPLPCDVRLECGHVCTEKCHVMKDGDHEHYICKKPCEKTKKNCKANHKCVKKCFEDCNLCDVKTNRKLPCGHKAFVQCHLEDSEVYCSEPVTKKIPGCGHNIDVKCSMIPTRADCSKECKMNLRCGHRCKLKCKEDCSSQPCQEIVTIPLPNLCGHHITMKCDEYYKGGSQITEKRKEVLLAECAQNCGAVLRCEHRCKGSCGRCFNGRVHVSCEEKCGRQLVCGHSCTVNCASSCPPCQQKCEYRCQHSKCAKLCCEPCARCQEPCGWSCEHFKCSRKCWQSCDRPPCDKPCKKKLRCGHPCIGLCGELCPTLCRICNKDQLTEFILYGNEEDGDARFVYLPDCGHCIEVEGMDHWMGMNGEESAEIQMKHCPRCKTIIRTCLRYGDILKKNYEDIVSVKKKLLSSLPSSQDFIVEMSRKLEGVLYTNDELKNDLGQGINAKFDKLLLALLTRMEPRKRQGKSILPTLDADERHAIQVKVDVVDRMLEVLKKSVKPEPSTQVNPIYQMLGARSRSSQPAMKPELLENIVARIERLFDSLQGRKRMSDAEYQDIIREINRLSFIRAFYLLKSSQYYDGNNRCDTEKALVEKLLMKNTKNLTERDKAQLKETMQAMAKKLQTGLGISDEERQQILKAVGLGQGHWYKCPNGHIYAIGECGGAMQRGVCNECGAAIGGGSHTLLATNEHAGEMDGSRFAAWSDARNNLANWDLNDIH